MNCARIALLCLLIVPGKAVAQQHVTKAPAPKPRADFSHEPFVIEQYATTARFENDGTGEEQLRVRVKVQSDAGALQWSELVFGFNSANEKTEVRYARVHKSDGTTVEVPVASAQVTVAAAARDFPAYANLKEERLAVPSLATGDTLEYEVSKRIVSAAAPGQFWFDHSFIESAIVLDERLAIEVPSARKVILKSSVASPYATQQLNGRSVYRWKHSNLQIADNSAQKDTDQTKAKPPDVQMTTFANWPEVARWYAKLEQGRADPTPEILAKTQELTQGRATDLEKTQALYDYVAKSVRNANLSFGASGYQPRPAAEVLSSRYGDSGDKHVLLAAMLGAVGIVSDAALIPSIRKLDPSLPSPAQFDHVITAAHAGKDLVWMDSTVDVAPFRLLASGLRKRPALLVSIDGAGKLVETPADPPFISTQHVEISGEVTELGKLTATAHYSVRGDAELVLRSAFRKTPEAQWKELGQTILSLDGIHGEVTSVKAGDPTATQDPFQLDIGFTQSDFFDWSSKRTRAALPLLAIGLPDLPSDKTQPIDLGSPLNVSVSLKLRLPSSISAQPPIGVSVAHDYADFSATYQFADHVLAASRSVDFKMRQLPASRGEEYAAFMRAVAADENQPLIIENVAPGGPAIPASATTDELLEAGLASFNAGNPQAAVPLFERVVQLEPQHKHAWTDLGLAYLRAGKDDEGIAAFRKQLEVNPSDEHANEYLGLALSRQQKYAEAVAAFRKQIQINPLDSVAHAQLGEILLDQREYPDAVTELEKATILSPENPELQVSLGRAYASTGETDAAIAAFDKAASLSRSPAILNDVAFNLAEHKLALDKAQRYAELAIADAAAHLRNANLAQVTDAELGEVADLAADWDTLGWVYFQRGDPDRAMPYVRAAWVLSEDGEAGDHLAQIYEKLGQKDRAIHMCALALAAPHAVPDTRARLTLLLGGNEPIEALVGKAKLDLDALRTIPAGQLLAEDTRAEFFVLLSSGEKKAHVDAVKFISGSEVLRPLAERLRSLDFGPVFPDGAPAKLIRRGMLTCSSKTGDCAFSLTLPEDARATEK